MSTTLQNFQPAAPITPAEMGNPHPHAAAHINRIREELISCGVTKWGLMYQECHYLPQLLQYDESIKGVVYGNFQGNRAMMVATDRRVIFLDKKPLFFKSDELTYNIVGGVTYSSIGYRATLVLHTRLGDYSFKVLNKRCAMNFKNYIDLRLDQRLEHDAGDFFGDSTSIR